MLVLALFSLFFLVLVTEKNLQDADFYGEIADNRTLNTSHLKLSGEADDFRPFRNYSISVAAVNRIGIGAENSTVVRTAEAGLIESIWFKLGQASLPNSLLIY